MQRTTLSGGGWMFLGLWKCSLGTRPISLTSGQSLTSQRLRSKGTCSACKHRPVLRVASKLFELPRRKALLPCGSRSSALVLLWSMLDLSNLYNTPVK